MNAVIKTAGLTAVWRQMAKVDQYAKYYTSIYTKIIGYILGKLDSNSVKTIAQRTLLIDSLIKKINPKTIVEIGAGYSSRSLRFKNIKCYNLDLQEFKGKLSNSIFVPFDARKDYLKDHLNDYLNLKIENTLFIVEGLTMYLKQHEVENLLRQIKKYKCNLVVDFFNQEYSRKNKTLNEKLFKLLFKTFIKKGNLFDYRIKNIDDGKVLLNKFGFKNICNYNYNIPHTLDALFYAKS